MNDCHTNDDESHKDAEADLPGPGAPLPRPVDTPEDYQRLFDLVPDAIWIDQHHSIVLVNAACINLLRANDSTDILGRSPFDFIHPDYHGLIRSRIPQALANPGRMPVIQERLVRLDGTEVHVEVNASRFVMGGKPAIVAIFRDISERIVAQQSVEAAEAQLRLVTDACPVMIAYIDRSGLHRYSNRAFDEWFGGAEEDAPFHISARLGANNFAALQADIEAALNGNQALIERPLLLPNGSRQEAQISLVPDISPSNDVRGVVIVAADITSLKNIQTRQRFMVDLLERTRGLADVSDALSRTVTMLGEHLGVSRCFYAELDPVADVVSVMADYHPGLPAHDSSYRLAAFEMPGLPDLLAGKPSSLSDIEAGHRSAVFSCRASLAVPTTRGERRAVLAVQTAERRQWSEFESDLLLRVAERTWLTVESVRIRQREHHIAATLQRSLLEMPASDTFPGLAIHTEYKPALSEADVGGDFLDAFSIGPNKVALVVGDVAGKGLAAAGRTAETRFVLRAFLRSCGDPGEALTRVNSVILTSDSFDTGKPHAGFVCLALVVIDTITGEIAASTAGGEPPLLVTSAGVVTLLDAPAPPLGVQSAAHYGVIQAIQNPGDTIVMATDGITEARRNSRMFGIEGLVNASSLHAAVDDIDIAAQRILDAARRFGGAFRDDVALLLARRR